MMKIKDCFDKNGKFIKSFDPYRCKNDDPLYLALFDEDGSATKVNAVYELIIQNKWPFNCDAVKYWYAENIDDACHGNYTAIYAWR